jgi:hypothetical protein
MTTMNCIHCRRHVKATTKFKEMMTTTSCGETICLGVAPHQDYPWWGTMVVWDGTKPIDSGSIPQFVKQVWVGRTRT